MIEIVPITLKEANAFVSAYHRHHGPVTGHKFSIGLAGGLRWTGRRKPTVDLYPAQMKVRYQREVKE